MNETYMYEKKSNTVKCSGIHSNTQRVLLATLPFWTPLIPPLGIASLKSYLQPYGFHVTTIDANVNDDFKEIYNRYFNRLEEIVPEDRKGNFYSIGHEVLRNHLMAKLHKQTGLNSEKYAQLIALLVEKTFFCSITSSQIEELDALIETFYEQLETWLIHLLETVQPDVLGLSVYSDTNPASLFAFKLTREKYPHIKTVMGGGIFADQLATHSDNLKIFLEKTQSFIDHMIIGEGEELFLKLLQGDLPQTQRVFTLNDLNGRTLDLSTVSVPDFSDFEIDYYPYIATYMSRSCPFQCSFCAETINWGKYRKKNISQAVNELKQIYEKHGYQLFLIGDSLLNPLLDQLSEELVKANLPIYWDGYLRADLPVCDIENTLKWRKGGFYRARMGIESGSQSILDAMGKKITPQQIKNAVSSLAYAGIKTTTYWIMGYPGETEEDFRQTLNLVAELKDNIYEAECKPFYYHPSGQVKSEQWMSEFQRVALYPENTMEYLMLQTWLIDCLPQREEMYGRVSRFIQHCKDLGIPNPYTMKEIYDADHRWKNLHKNAVPPLVELRDKSVTVNESRDVKPLTFAQQPIQEDDDFGF